MVENVKKYSLTKNSLQNRRKFFRKIHQIQFFKITLDIHKLSLFGANVEQSLVLDPFDIGYKLLNKIFCTLKF